jgi:histidinol-phosphate aminotransferase
VAPRPLIRPALDGLVPYEPGKPVEEVQRELGLERVVKLASNEGPFGPFPSALEALARCAPELNRYPDGGAYRLRRALAERLDVRFEQIALGAGADGVIDTIAQAVLDPGDEVVTGWPSFPSYVIYATKLGAEPRLAPLEQDRIDLDGLLAAVTPRTKLVCIAHPNNPTGTSLDAAELDAYFERVPDHVLTVLDQAYFEYLADANYPDGVERYFQAGRRVIVLRTFSKIFGLAGLRIGYGIGPEDVVTAIGKVRRPFDLSTVAQEMAIASLGDAAEIERRRELNAAGRAALERALAEAGYRVARPPVANFVYADVGEDARAVFDALLRLGVIVRPLHGFGAPTAIRVTVGTPEETEIFADALGQLRLAV